MPLDRPTLGFSGCWMFQGGSRNHCFRSFWIMIHWRRFLCTWSTKCSVIGLSTYRFTRCPLVLGPSWNKRGEQPINQLEDNPTSRVDANKKGCNKGNKVDNSLAHFQTQRWTNHQLLSIYWYIYINKFQRAFETWFNQNTMLIEKCTIWVRGCYGWSGMRKTTRPSRWSYECPWRHEWT